MEKEITTSFILAQIKLKCRLVKLSRSYCVWEFRTCVTYSSWRVQTETFSWKRGSYVSVRFGCPFFWQVCWMWGWKTFRFCSIGSSEKLVLAGSIMWYELSSVWFFFFSSYKNVISEMHILLLNLCWVFCRFWSSRVGSFVCIFLYLA